MSASGALGPPELRRLLEAATEAQREQGWAEFVETHSRLLLHTAGRFARQRDARMDAFAFILEELKRDDFRRLRGYVDDGSARFSTWLVVVARRLCLDFLRGRYGRFSGSAAADASMRQTRRRLTDFLTEELGAATDAADPASDHEKALLDRERRRALEAALERLSADDRLLMTFRFEDGRPAREIQTLMRLPTPFHVYRRVNAVLLRLRHLLAERGIDGPEG